MLNMILNTIFRCDNNGLWPINSISLARVIAISLVREINVSNVGKHRHGYMDPTILISIAPPQMALL